jgi:hypothetical protein
MTQCDACRCCCGVQLSVGAMRGGALGRVMCVLHMCMLLGVCGELGGGLNGLHSTVRASHMTRCTLAHGGMPECNSLPCEGMCSRTHSASRGKFD